MFTLDTNECVCGPHTTDERACPMNGMARMDPAQRFHAFCEAKGGDKGTMVDVTGHITLMTEQGDMLPSLFVRMVPGQVDDVLVAAPASVGTTVTALSVCGTSRPKLWLRQTPQLWKKNG